MLRPFVVRGCNFAGYAVGLVVIIILVTRYNPELWFHPFGPLTKNVSILVGTLVVLRRCRGIVLREPTAGFAPA